VRQLVGNPSLPSSPNRTLSSASSKLQLKHRAQKTQAPPWISTHASQEAPNPSYPYGLRWLETTRGVCDERVTE
jgi:hypothetical protein